MPFRRGAAAAHSTPNPKCARRRNKRVVLHPRRRCDCRLCSPPRFLDSGHPPHSTKLRFWDPLESSLAMTGRGKKSKAAASGGSEKQPPNKKPKPSPSMWCTECWSWETKSKCSKAGQAKHRCLPISEAMAEAQAAFDVVHEDMKRKEQQLLQVKTAFEEKGAVVLEARLDSHESDGKFWVEGGTFRIHLAATSVSEPNKEDLLEALEDSSMSFYGDEPSLSLPRDLVRNLFGKSPIRPNGVTLPRGTVLIEKGYHKNFLLKVYERGVLPHQGDGKKVFGRVSDDTLEAFQTCWCGGGFHCPDKFCDHEKGAEIDVVDARFL
ncbi:uncharacterized protein LOC117642043 isoform X3 [Thrips palmi]|uniref:Uncharacterized protein LOC117642043 isoform X3 n=1 Tax=Thrips palmi TaxID=161013 RepID=A0A6P8YFK5_THRPL|nr:uncharacterized protein LOC117642043 isoform X3 [Thrips palmi]